MKFIFLLFIVFAATQCTSTADTKEAQDAWNAFQAQFAKKYNSVAEEKFRMKIFMENKLKIDTHNQKYEKGLVSYSQGINKFSDMLHSEIIAIHTGFKNTSPDKLKGATYISPANLKVPDSVNWTDKGAVTRVKNQGGCGSCWAFSATGSLEGQVFIKNGKLVALSEQFLVDCSRSNLRCGGGEVDLAYDDIVKIGGIDTEESYPYEGVYRHCRYDPKNSGANVTGYTYIPQYSEEKLTEAIANIGPIAVTIECLNSFIHYHHGIYHDPKCKENPDLSDLGHAVLAVGYGTDKASGKDYYIVKNSWGAHWGEHGYARMERNTVPNCGIAAYALFPLIQQQKPQDSHILTPSSRGY